MSDYEIGYKKTDPKTRWKPGQCGNPKKKRPLKMPDVAQMINDEFARMVSIKENGKSRKITVLEIILHHLMLETGRANKRAVRILKKYRTFAQSNPSVVYEPADDAEQMAAEYKKHLEEGLTLRTKEEADFDKAFRELSVVEMADFYRDMVQSTKGQEDW